MQHILSLYKPLGLTPLQAIDLFREQNPSYKDAIISYAGRLDPMAEGLLLLLLYDENKKRKVYEALSKTYEFSMLLGVSTDTYDLLGKITNIDASFDEETIIAKVQKILPSLLGKQTMPYPPFSSRTVKGKPLYWWAREQRLHEIEIPTREITITSLQSLTTRTIAKDVFIQHLHQTIPSVVGAFRQTEIMRMWDDSSPLLPASLPLLSFQMICTSGTYVRGMVNSMSEKLGIPTTTYSIKRIRVGEWKVKDAMRLKHTEKR